MNRKSLSHWEHVWDQAVSLKTPADRRDALEQFLTGPFEVLLKLSQKNRTLMQHSPGRLSVGDWRELFFATSHQSNVLQDVVHIRRCRSQERIKIEEILICHHVIVGLVPNGCYLIRELVHAAAGSSGGHRVVNVTEYLGGCYPDFSDDFKAALPQLKIYKFRGRPVRCAWSTRGLHLSDWQKRLRAMDDTLLAALKEFTETFWWTEATDEVQSQIRKALNPFLLPHLSSPDAAIKNQALWAWRALNGSAPLDTVSWPKS